MIKDNLPNSASYYGISEYLKQGFEWIKNNNLADLPDGKYYIDGENLFANVQTYYTKSDAPFEAHRKYIDIQYMIDGEEVIGVAEYSSCSQVEDYDKERDIEFLTNNTDYTKQMLKKGEFLVLFPQDAHQPSLNVTSSQKVKKVVVKVKI